MIIKFCGGQYVAEVNPNPESWFLNSENLRKVGKAMANDIKIRKSLTNKYPFYRRTDNSQNTSETPPFFVLGISEGYYSAVLSLKNDPVKSVACNIISTSLAQAELLKLFKKNELIIKHDAFVHCKSCSRITFSKLGQCAHCTMKGDKIYTTYELPNEIHQVWTRNFPKFIEAWVFWVCMSNAKKLGEVYPNVEVKLAGKKETFTELDIYLKNKNIVIMCSRNPFHSDEKAQLRKFKALGLKVISVTHSRKSTLQADAELRGITDDENFEKHLLDAINSLEDDQNEE